VRFRSDSIGKVGKLVVDWEMSGHGHTHMPHDFGRGLFRHSSVELVMGLVREEG
jgi:hypothetical protein